MTTCSHSLLVWILQTLRINPVLTNVQHPALQAQSGLIPVMKQLQQPNAVQAQELTAGDAENVSSMMKNRIFKVFFTLCIKHTILTAKEYTTHFTLFLRHNQYTQMMYCNTEMLLSHFIVCSANYTS